MAADSTALHPTHSFVYVFFSWAIESDPTFFSLFSLYQFLPIVRIQLNPFPHPFTISHMRHTLLFKPFDVQTFPKQTTPSSFYRFLGFFVPSLGI